GRRTPYFFNAGLFNDGASLATLGRFYAEALMAAGVPFDMLFGPAYKGITLAASTAIALAQNGHNVPFSFNRKEAKDHGEGGDIVGAPLAGRVVIVDDVITDGGAKREAIERVRAAGATPVAIMIAFDRKERGRGALSAVQEITRDFGVPVVAIATLDDLRRFIDAATARNTACNEHPSSGFDRGARLRRRGARARCATRCRRDLQMDRRQGRRPLHRQDARRGHQQGGDGARQAGTAGQAHRSAAHARAARRARRRGEEEAGAPEKPGGSRSPGPRADAVVHERRRDRAFEEARARDDRRPGAVVARLCRAARQAQGRDRG